MINNTSDIFVILNGAGPLVAERSEESINIEL